MVSINKLGQGKQKGFCSSCSNDESVPSDVTYNTLTENRSNIEFKSAVALIRGFCMKGLMNEADRVFESMLQRNYKPDEAAHNVIIHGHSRGGNIQKAYDLYKEMVNSGFVPHTVTVIALVKHYSLLVRQTS